MTRVLVPLGAILLGAVLAFGGLGSALAGPPSPPMGVTIRSVKPTTVTAKHASVAFRLKVTGLTLDATHIGKANVNGHGHIQLYVDSVPKDAYTKKDLKHHWLASLAAPDFTLKLLPAVLGGKGKHTIIIGLAQNNYVLYHTPLARVTITAR